MSNFFYEMKNFSLFTRFNEQFSSHKHVCKLIANCLSFPQPVDKKENKHIQSIVLHTFMFSLIVFIVEYVMLKESKNRKIYTEIYYQTFYVNILSNLPYS